VSPKVSVVMSVYNNGRYLAEAVDSVLSQSFDDFEFIIIDDCSTDGASETLEKYASQDSRIVLVKNETNIGLTKSLNKTLKIAKGEYIARMDGDDICLPDRFKKQVEYLDRNPDIALVFADIFLIDKNSKDICMRYRPKSIKKMLLNLEICNYFPHPAVMLRGTAISALGGYNESCRTGQDQNLWIRMRDAGYLFGYVNEILLKYRVNPDSVRGEERYNYWFKVAIYCIWNNSRCANFRYWKNLTLLQMVEMFIRALMPFSFYLRRLK